MIKYLLLIILLFFINFTIKSQVIINNQTDYEVDNLIRKTCTLLGVDSVFINVRYFNDIIHWEDISYKFHGAVFNNGNSIYTILLYDDNYTKRNLERIVVHETIHIYQFHSGRLIRIKENVYDYDGKIINMREIKYEDRQFEIDAHKYESEILSVVGFLFD